MKELKNKVVELISNFNIKYEIDEFPKTLRINFDLLELAKDFNIQFYEEEEGYYIINNNKEFVDIQIKILNIINLIIDNYPTVKINQSHLATSIFINL